MPIYELLEYDSRNNCHKVKDESGVTRLVDVMVNGDFPEGTEPESIVGQKVECEYEYPYIAIAMRVRIVGHNIRLNLATKFQRKEKAH